eukprot:354140-Chlamydomonas_euryale.AAC.11
MDTSSARGRPVEHSHGRPAGHTTLHGGLLAPVEKWVDDTRCEAGLQVPLHTPTGNGRTVGRLVRWCCVRRDWGRQQGRASRPAVHPSQPDVWNFWCGYACRVGKNGEGKTAGMRAVAPAVCDGHAIAGAPGGEAPWAGEATAARPPPGHGA